LDTLNKIIDIMKQNKIMQKQLTAHLGLGEGTFAEWKSGKSKSYIKYISQISEFLGVSTDYLLGNEQKEKSLPSEKEKLLELYDLLGDEGKANLLDQAKLLIQARK